MFASALTAIFFSLSVLFAARSSRLLGGPLANAGRVTVALVALALWAHLFGAGLGGPSLAWFIVSGAIGFGLGDLALFAALPRIGPRLSILLTQCLAAPVAALVEWVWLGTRLHAVELACAGIILAGVALALAPDHGWVGERRVFWLGVLAGIGSALGQALGAVASRKANALAAAAHFSIDGGTAAYQRMLGGVVFTYAALWLMKRWNLSAEQAAPAWGRAWPLVLGNALAGPVVGVGCYQWALQTQPSGIVLPIVATSPLITMVLAFWVEGTRVSRRALSGAVVAVAGAALLKAVHG